jgi:hypothetical protein
MAANLKIFRKCGRWRGSGGHWLVSCAFLNVLDVKLLCWWRADVRDLIFFFHSSVAAGLFTGQRSKKRKFHSFFWGAVDVDWSADWTIFWMNRNGPRRMEESAWTQPPAGREMRRSDDRRDKDVHVTRLIVRADWSRLNAARGPIDGFFALENHFLTIFFTFDGQRHLAAFCGTKRWKSAGKLMEWGFEWADEFEDLMGVGRVNFGSIDR